MSRTAAAKQAPKGLLETGELAEETGSWPNAADVRGEEERAGYHVLESSRLVTTLGAVASLTSPSGGHSGPLLIVARTFEPCDASITMRITETASSTSVIWIDCA